jgi:hypothetical protein
MRWALLAAVLLAGCQIGGGPTLGYRHGKVTGGWQVGVGGVADDSGFGVQGSAGLSWRGHQAYTYSALDLQFFEHDMASARFDGASGTLGFSGGNGGYHLLVGLEPFLGSAQGGACDQGWLTTLAFGVRWFGGESELYVSPRVSYFEQSCASFDAGGGGFPDASKR